MYTVILASFRLDNQHNLQQLEGVRGSLDVVQLSGTYAAEQASWEGSRKEGVDGGGVASPPSTAWVWGWTAARARMLIDIAPGRVR